MAEILVAARSFLHPDPTVDRRGSWKRGDFVAVHEDGHAWGRKEGLPRFVIIKLPGVPAARVQAYMAEETTQDPFLLEPVRVGRRRWRLRVDDVPLAIRNALRTTGVVSTTWTQLRNFVQDKATLASAPELETATTGGR